MNVLLVDNRARQMQEARPNTRPVTRVSRHASRYRRALSGWTDVELWRPVITFAWVAVAGVLVLGALFLHDILTLVLVKLHYNDFGKFYYSAEAGRRGLSMYAPSVATNIQISERTWIQFWNMNPPHFQIVLWPLTWLPIQSAYVVWMSINVGIAFLTVGRIASALERRVKPAWLLFALVAAPTLSTTVTGQVTGIVFGLVSWIWLDMRDQRWARAGSAIGIACSIKPFLAPLVIYLVLRKQWRAVAIAAASGTACFLVGLAVFGVGAHIEWFNALRSVSWEWAPMNGSIYAPLARLGARTELAMGEAPTVHRVAQSLGHLLAMAILAVGGYAAYRDDNTDRAVLVVLATCLLASPLGWIYYGWILVGPIWACWDDPTIRRALVIAGVGWLIPFFVLWKFDSVPFILTIGAAYTWSFLAIWLAAVVARWSTCPNRLPATLRSAPV